MLTFFFKALAREAFEKIRNEKEAKYRKEQEDTIRGLKVNVFFSLFQDLSLQF